MSTKMITIIVYIRESYSSSSTAAGLLKLDY